METEIQIRFVACLERREYFVYLSTVVKKIVVLHTKGKDVVVQTMYGLEYMFCGTDFDT